MLHALLRISSPLSPSSGEEVVSRVRQALSRLMTSAARQSALVAAANPNLATRAQASSHARFQRLGLQLCIKQLVGDYRMDPTNGPVTHPQQANCA